MSPSLSSARRALLWRALFLFALGICFESCGRTYDQMVVVVNVANLLPDVQRIQVSASLNRLAAMRGMNITDPLNQFAIQLPYTDNNLGMLEIDLTAFSAEGCQAEKGQVAVTLLSGQYQYEVTANLAPLPTKLCTLTVNVSGSGQVASSPSGIKCGSTCTADFPFGTAVTLDATAMQLSSAQLWSGACGGSAAIPCKVAMVKSQSVGATFPPNCFATATTINAGLNPSWIAAADFNGDKLLDLAIVNRSNNNVTILLGNGAGGFALAPGSPLGLSPQPAQAVVGDFDGDGKLDLAVLHWTTSSSLSILAGDGAGGFTVKKPYDVNSSLFSGIAAGDFNGDTKLDLAFTSHSANMVYVMLGTGAGMFGSATSIATGTSPWGIAVGDFNADTKLDLAVANQDINRVSVLLGNGAGGFGPAPSSPFSVGSAVSPVTVVVGDFNGDAKPDLAVTATTSNTASILLGLGAGDFAAAQNSLTGTNPVAAALGDFNGDMKLDLVAGNQVGQNLSLLLGNGMGGLSDAANSPFSFGMQAVAIAAGDFNGDMKPDIAVINGVGSDSLRILINQSSSSLGCR